MIIIIIIIMIIITIMIISIITIIILKNDKNKDIITIINNENIKRLQNKMFEALGFEP